MHIQTQIDGVFFGKISPLWENKPPSAIHKTSVKGPQKLEKHGFTGDNQADLEAHGGEHKAVHHYPAEHYAKWIQEGEVAQGTIPAAFGENISTRGFTEDILCIGDVFQIGSATVQISQGRQPCWKLNSYTGNKKLAFLFQKTGRTGWYYRVLDAGMVSPLDMISLIDRPNPDWSVEFVTRARLTRQISVENAHHLSELSELAPSWRRAFKKMSKNDYTEDTNARLKG
ncbi:MAG: MOSC domain-containing protein [Litorimonas sp.]